MSTREVNSSCDSNFKRIDKDMDVVREDIKEIGKKLATVDSTLNSQSNDLNKTKIDHDDVIIVKRDVNELKNQSIDLNVKIQEMRGEQIKISGEFDDFANDIASNMANLAAYQNSTIDKLTLLVKREPYSDIKSKILSGIMVGFTVATVVGIFMFILSHAVQNIKTELIKSMEIERIKQVDQMQKFNRRMDKNGEYEKKSIQSDYYR